MGHIFTEQANCSKVCIHQEQMHTFVTFAYVGIGVGVSDGRFVSVLVGIGVLVGGGGVVGNGVLVGGNVLVMNGVLVGTVGSGVLLGGGEPGVFVGMVGAGVLVTNVAVLPGVIVRTGVKVTRRTTADGVAVTSRVGVGSSSDSSTESSMNTSIRLVTSIEAFTGALGGLTGRLLLSVNCTSAF
jgi:hypothetical protein